MPPTMCWIDDVVLGVQSGPGEVLFAGGCW